ncbi:hypothetical protein HKBW3S43_01010, partial [Candidatus Hakubella thermalkaliphila]
EGQMWSREAEEELLRQKLHPSEVKG